MPGQQWIAVGIFHSPSLSPNLTWITQDAFAQGVRLAERPAIPSLETGREREETLSHCTRVQKVTNKVQNQTSPASKSTKITCPHTFAHFIAQTAPYILCHVVNAPVQLQPCEM